MGGLHGKWGRPKIAPPDPARCKIVLHVDLRQKPTVNSGSTAVDKYQRGRAAGA
jgi:hypothetical protein